MLEPVYGSHHLRFFIGTPVTCDFFGLAGDPYIGAAEVFT
jgi:hypothetical protein